MNQPDFDLKAAHRWFGVQLNNECWELLESANRSREQDERMLHASHASCFHWMQAGTPVHHLRALVLVAQCHAALGDGAGALRHATRARELAEANEPDTEDWDLPFILEATARGHAAAGEREEALRWKSRAREAGDAIRDPADRELFDRGFRRGNWYGAG